MDYEAMTEEAPFTPEMESNFLQIVVDLAPAELAELEGAVDDSDTFVHLPRAAAAAFHLQRFEEAKRYAERAIELAPLFQKNWNYGNAIHFGHTVLGLLALNDGDLVLAAAELRKSGNTPGSPQLNSFGPTMQLAKALLKQGSVDVVIEYLSQCRLFWKRGAIWLDLWEQKIFAGQIPNFFQHSHA
jgi:tetratricopeptide (TPR) repeat protein